MADVTIRFKGDERDAVRAADATKRSIGGIDDQAKRTGPNLKALGVVALGAFAALGLAARTGFGELAEGQVVTAQTEAVLKSTGGAANVTADEIGSLATSLSNLSGTDDELIQKGANLLLTFKQVRNEVGEGNRVFDRATAAALDLSVAGFGSLESTSKQLGKALNDPVKGMTALGRAGVTFTQKQRDTIEALVETGDELGAQKLILAEVESQVGGSAKAYGETLPGQLAKARVSYENLAGNLVSALLPALVAVAGALNGVFSFLSEHETTTKIIVGLFVALAAAMATVSVATSAVAAATAAYTAVQWLLNVALTANPIGVVVVALAALVAGIIIAWRESETFRAIVTGAFDAVRAAAEFVLDFFRTHWKTIAVLISGPFAPIVLLATDAFGVRSAIIGAFNAVIAFVRNRWPEMAVLIAGPFAPLVALATDAFGVRSALIAAGRAVVSWFREHWQEIAVFIAGPFAPLVALATDAFGIRSALVGAFRAILNAAQDVFGRIRGLIRDFGDTVVPIVKKVAEALVGPAQAAAEALRPIQIVLSLILNTMSSIIGTVDDLIDNLNKIKGAVAGAAGAVGGAVGGVLGRQHGGFVRAGQPYIVGEAGPEVFLPMSAGTIIPNHALGSMSSGPVGGALGGMTLVLQVEGDFIGDRSYVEDLAMRLLPHLRNPAAYHLPV